MIEIKSRLPDVGTTIFTVMSKLAQDYNAINLSQGFPDFEIDPQLVELVHKYMLAGHHQYAPMPGVFSLRKAIAEIVSKTYNHTVDPEDEITITAGATEAIYAAIAAFISPGDEVILFDPSYDSYDPAIRLNGGVPVHINLKFPGYTPDWAAVRSKITSRTKMIMINTPHNPCGVVLKAEDMLELQSIALENKLIVLSDEVYERIVFDEQTHQSVLRYPDLAAQSIALFSFGKTFHATGWKVGYTVSPAYLQHEIRKAHQYITFSVNTSVQLALAEYLTDSTRYEELGKFYQHKRDFFLEHLKGSSLEPLHTDGSYFQLCSYQHFHHGRDVDMAKELTQRLGVASIPVSVFYQDKTDNHLLRFCFAKKEETLFKACEILRKL
ncbi:MAG TPA: methionine aminotransferase [Ohtaekwangia sp.]|nr:methionine aminotransferase [Ohtaekwangia sp.]